VSPLLRGCTHALLSPNVYHLATHVSRFGVRRAGVPIKSIWSETLEFAETKEIDIQKLQPSVFPRQGVYFGQYKSMLENTPMPALLPIGETNGICFLHTQGNKELVYKTIQSIILRLLLQINPGLLKLTLYDSTGSGKNLIGLSHIDRNIKGENILTEQNELKRALENDVVSGMNTTIQKVLGYKYADKTLIDYNEIAGKQAKPYHIVCITDFPNGLGKEHSELISKIMQSGKTYLLKEFGKNNHVPLYLLWKGV
jgi:hypothetical protein